jgi:hypothetical protein
VAEWVEDGDAGGASSTRSAALTALEALLAAVERRLDKLGIGRLPDAFFLGAARATLVPAMQRGVLNHVAVLDWPTFHRVAPTLCAKGLDGFRAAVSLSLPAALTSGVTASVVDAVEQRARPRRHGVTFGRLTRATGGHLVFRSQLLLLAEAEFDTTPLELAHMLERHTPDAVRAILHGRLIRKRPDLVPTERHALLASATQHLGRLLPEAETAAHALRLLRLTYYLLHHPIVTRPVLRRVRIVDFQARRAERPRQVEPRP